MKRENIQYCLKKMNHIVDQIIFNAEQNSAKALHYSYNKLPIKSWNIWKILLQIIWCLQEVKE